MSLENETAYGNALDSVTKIVSVYLERSTGLSPGQVVSLVDGIFGVLLRDPNTAPGHPTLSSGSVNADSNVRALETAATPASIEPPKPAVPVDQSVTPDYLVCLEDGNKVKLLKRYLRSKYDLTPRQYREKWSLAKDYPMVAPSYSARRTAIAQASGLGARRPIPADNTASVTTAATSEKPQSSNEPSPSSPAARKAASRQNSPAVSKPAEAGSKKPRSKPSVVANTSTASEKKPKNSKVNGAS